MMKLEIRNALIVVGLMLCGIWALSTAVSSVIRNSHATENLVRSSASTDPAAMDRR